MGSYAYRREANYLTRHLTLYLPKVQQSVRHLRPFANKNEVKSSNEEFEWNPAVFQHFWWPLGYILKFTGFSG